MMNINELLGDVVTTYQDISEVVAAMDGDPDTIYFYSPGIPEAPLYTDALQKMQNPSILVSHLSTVMGERGGMHQWRHTIRLDCKLPSELGETNYFDLLQMLVDGIPSTSDGLTVEQCSFNNLCDSMEDIIMVPVVEQGIFFYRVEFALQEKGGSGT